MKLISLHINNFGKLSNFDHNFDQSIDSICEDNGYGKTTLTAFILAMLYGMKSYTRSTKEFVDRKHYYPFNHGNFGGNLVFSWNNKEYRIERSFDAKSETSDTMKVYVNGTETNELGEVPGITIFKINQENFKKLIIVSSKEITIQGDEDINKKLNNYVENVDDNFDYDEVQSKIKEAEKGQNNKSKDQIKPRIASIKQDISNLEIKERSIPEKQEKLNELSVAKELASNRYNDAKSNEALLSKWERFDEYEQTINELNEKIKAIEDKYPNGLLTEEEIKTVKENNKNILSKTSVASGNSLSDEQVRELKRLKEEFKVEPTDEELSSLSDDIKQYNEYCSKLYDMSLEVKNEWENPQKDDFHGELPSEETLKSLDKDYNEYKTKVEDLSNTPKTIQQKAKVAAQESKKQSKALYLILLGVAIVLLGAGVGLLFVSKIVGIILLVVGGVTLLADAFLYFNNSIKALKNSTVTEQLIEGDNPEYLSKKEELNKLETKIKLFFARYQYEVEGTTIYELYTTFKHDVEDHSKLLLKKRQRAEKSQVLNDAANELSKAIKERLLKYVKDVEPYSEVFDKIKIDYNQFKTLKQTEEAQKKNQDNATDAINASKKVIANIYDSKKISLDETIDTIENDSKELTRLNEELSKNVADKDKYKTDNNLTDKPEEVLENSDELFEEVRSSEKAYNDLYDEIKGIEEEVAKLDDLRNELSEKEIELQVAKDKAKLYKSIQVELEKANNTLKEKYVAPIKNKFIEYAAKVDEELGSGVSMDKNYRIQFDIEGELRSYEHLSTGKLALCALCFRLAILDNMFEGELPFVILDDPFTPLDETHLGLAKELVNELSSNKQILYFTCHSDRQISK